MNYSTIYNHFDKGDSVFIAGTSAEPRAFVNALSAAQDLPEITITNTFIPGVNTAPLATLDNYINEIVFFPRPGKLFETERIRYKRYSWLGAYNYLEQQQFDWLVLQLSPPDYDGMCSMGACIEFLPLLLQQSKKVIGIINQQVPSLANSPRIKFNSLDLTVECDESLVSTTGSVPDDISAKISMHLATLIDQGSILQTGIGKIPDIFMKNLKQHRNLKFESGMLSDGFLELHDAGALDPDFNHHCTLCLGSQEFYTRLPEIGNLSLVPVNVSHALVSVNSNSYFVAINSAIQVDLGGRANLEFIGNKRVSNVGGALDFARRAGNEKNGKNIIALPATAKSGQVSRIVNHFDDDQKNSLAGTDIDFVVTEYGIADLRGASRKGKSERLMNITAPKFQNQY